MSKIFQKLITIFLISCFVAHSATCEEFGSLINQPYPKVNSSFKNNCDRFEEQALPLPVLQMTQSFLGRIAARISRWTALRFESRPPFGRPSLRFRFFAFILSAGAISLGIASSVY